MSTIPNTDISTTFFNNTPVYDYLSSGDVVINNNNFLDNSLTNDGTGIGSKKCLTTDTVLPPGVLTYKYAPYINETRYSWTVSNSTTSTIGSGINIAAINLYHSAFDLYFNFPKIYEFALAFLFIGSTGTGKASQTISFPTAGTYTLSFCIGVRVTKYIPQQTLSITIDDNLILENWNTTTPSVIEDAEAKFMISNHFRVTAGQHNLSISSTIPDDVTTGTIDYSTICITGLSIRKINFDSILYEPWGVYNASQYYNDILPDITGNGNHASKITGNGDITLSVASGNGAVASIPYIFGSSNSQLLWPIGSIPTNFTICSITRYYDESGYNRILTSTSNNWLHGHHSNKRGVAYYDGWKTNQVSRGNLTDWLVMCGNNGTDSTNNFLVDNITVERASGGGIGGGDMQLSINKSNFGENSKWCLAYLIIYNRVLNNTEMSNVSYMLTNYLSTGNMNITSPPYIFEYTGNDQNFTVPNNAISVKIQCWGAGGARPMCSSQYINSGHGGGGGFTEAIFYSGIAGQTLRGQTLRIIVGEGGKTYSGSNNTSRTYGGGGSRFGVDQVVGTASGGGRSAVQISSDDIITAGGGGGAGIIGGSVFIGTDFSGFSSGGEGGDLTGKNAFAYDTKSSNPVTNLGAGGGGGTQTSGGAPGPGSSSAGEMYKGGNTSYIAGGGGGYYGGGGGGVATWTYESGKTGIIYGGGGGGSSYVTTLYGATNPRTSQGSGHIVAGASYLPSGKTDIGNGAPENYEACSGADGQNGLVIITVITE